MAPYASSVTKEVAATGPEQRPVSSPTASVAPPSATQRDRLRPLGVAECSLCGIALPLGLLVPDGGQACADIRWYCKDAVSCTERWTAARPARGTHMPAASAVAAAGEGVPASLPEPLAAARQP
jgi:hypothetical protein